MGRSEVSTSVVKESEGRMCLSLVEDM